MNVGFFFYLKKNGGGWENNTEFIQSSIQRGITFHHGEIDPGRKLSQDHQPFINSEWLQYHDLASEFFIFKLLSLNTSAFKIILCNATISSGLLIYFLVLTSLEYYDLDLGSLVTPKFNLLDSILLKLQTNGLPYNHLTEQKDIYIHLKREQDTTYLTIMCSYEKVNLRDLKYLFL